MSRPKSYRLLCPIARALDRVGDRWTLLIVRDLHAGPARFGELQSALPGLASNLLSSRLVDLEREGLVARVDNAYQLTEAGQATAPLLFELAAFGSRFAPPVDPKRPGNLRLVAVTLKEALRRVVDDSSRLEVELIVDDEAFFIEAAEGNVTVRYGSAPSAPLAVETDYEAMIAIGDGALSSAQFAKDHVRVSRGTRKAARQFLSLLGAAFSPGA
ncbi:MAG: helix-turn-helix transcriptional regulator [Deltaproteobacteria bacterium]|nr:helix-turn-helix transcriptional regulator [Deltaproteobacteria bacterium]